MTTNFSFVGSELYSPPQRAVVNFSWRSAPIVLKFAAGEYTAPAGDSLRLSWQAGPHPAGWDSAEFGTAEVKRAIRYLFVSGIPAEYFSDPLVKLYTRYVSAPAIGSTLVYGTPYLYNRNKQLTIYPFTGQPITPPSPKVYNLLQFLRPGGVASPFVAGTARVSNYLRYLAVPGLAVTHTFGTTKLSLGRRYITNVYISTTLTSFGTPFIAWGNREVFPVGYLATAFGTPLTKEKAQRCYPVGRASLAAFGTPLVRERTQRAYPFN